MKKCFKITLICLPAFALLGFTVFILWLSDAFVFDRSATVGAYHATWNGREYSVINGVYNEGRTIAKDKTGSWDINAVKEDPSHTFIVVRSFLDQYLMVADDYTVPTLGKITTACWNGKYIKDASFLKAITEIETQKEATFTYETDGIYRLTDNQHMRPLYFAYANCPVATSFKGYMGKVNGEWVITTHISGDTHNEDGSPKPYPVSCYIIPAEYLGAISKHFS